MKKDRKIFSREDIGIIGSYSSFLALLAIATVLAFRHLFDYIVELIVNKSPTSQVEWAFILILVLYALLFLVLPSIPLTVSITRAFRGRNRWLAWILIFISATYVFVVVSQFVYEVLVKTIEL